MRQRWTFKDTFFIVACTAIFASIGLVKVQRYRAAARTASCSDQMRQLALGFHNYHAAFRQLPSGCGGTSARPESRSHQNNAGRLSAWVGLLPFVEKQALWERISNPYQAKSSIFPAMGPVPWYDATAYPPWSMRPELYVCPSDNDAEKYPTAGSYVVNYGDAVHLVGFPVDVRVAQMARDFRTSDRGVFNSQRTRFRDILDGTSNTLFFSEKTIAGKPVARGVSDLAFAPENALSAAKDAATKYWDAGRDACWADGTLRSCGFQTILPPNSVSATDKQNELQGVMSASSFHVGGVHVAFVDGSVQFALDSIDHGNGSSPTVAMITGDDRKYGVPGSKSPYGIWGAMGTRASGERFDRNSVIELTDPPREFTASEKKEMLAEPAQVWTARDGNRTLSARQIDIQRESNVVLMTDNGDVKRIPLSQLASQDAYRAVEQYFAEKAKAQASLKTYLQEGVKLLDEKKYDEFASRYIAGGDLDPKGMGKLVAMERGLLLYRMEIGLRQLKAGNSAASFSEDKSGNMRVDFQHFQSTFAQLRLLYTDGRWKFAPR